MDSIGQLIDLKICRGADILTVLSDLAQLRMTVFREWPYLYDGTLEYEESYLRHMAASPVAFCVLALDGERVIGAATAGALEDQDQDFQQPLLKAGYAARDCLYCGESVLLEPYRGQGLGHRFFDAREEYGRSLGRTYSTFCRVLRPDDHPLRPDQPRSLDNFWRQRGYESLEHVQGAYSWKDLGQPEETLHAMEFWMRPL